MLIQSVRVVDAGQDRICDVRFGTQIEAVAEHIAPEPQESCIDGTGLVLMPALIDLNLRVQNDALTLKHLQRLSLQSLKGGVTTLALMPNSDPAIDRVEVVEYVLAHSGGAMQPEILPVCQGIRESEGVLSDMAILLKRGCVGVFARSSLNGNLLRRIFEYASMWNKPIFCRGEDTTLSGNGVMNEGFLSSKLGLPGIPGMAETKEVAKLCEISYSTDAPLVIQTVASERSIHLINQAKNEHASVYCEVSINHLSLTEEACNNYNTYAKIKPPLKSLATKNRLLESLRSGHVDFLTSAHAAKSITRKDQAFEEADFGIHVIEEYLALCLTHLYHAGILSLSRLSELTSLNQARLLKMEERKGRIAEGYDADLILVDIQKEHTVTHEATPYRGMRLKGEIRCTFRLGAQLYSAT